MDCDLELEFTYLYAGSAALWILLFIWWYSALTFRRMHVRPIHRLMTFTLLFKCLLDVSMSLHSATCPWKSPTAGYLYLARCSTYTLYFTFLFTLFLLVSKGYCVTRYGLFRQEVTVVAVMMGAVYLSYSAYTLDPENLYLLIFLVMAAVFFTTARYTLATIKTVRVHVINLQQANVQDLLRPVIQKFLFMKTFSKLLFGYFISELVLYVMMVPAYVLNFQAYFASCFAQELCEMITVGLLFVMFRPRDMGPYSTLPIVDANDPGQVRSPPPLLTATIPSSRLEDLSKLTELMPLVVLEPGDFSPDHPFENVDIGQLLSGPVERQPVRGPGNELRIN